MVIRPVVIAVICVGLFLIFESLMLPKAMAIRTNGIKMEDRVHKRRNHMLQRARDKEILKSLQKRGVSFDTEIELLDAAAIAIPELAYIEDYANTIDDEYFLDKSVETRTRKRGNFKREKYVNQAIPDSPCSCKTMVRYSYMSLFLILGCALNIVEDLEANVFPRKITTRKCNTTQDNNGCAPPYKCQEIYYNIPILKRKPFDKNEFVNFEDLTGLVPNNLSFSWTAVWKKIAVGCQCTNKYIETIPQK